MAAEHSDPLVDRKPATLRWWVIAAIVMTAVAVGVILSTNLLAQEPPWRPVDVPTGVPT
ncbi:MAG: hypothetical protein Q4G46_12610 [Propionibacteriaceae bacterium]|nr:hypothetical protein [Propionibacteriaceae bacterium]